MSFPIKKDPSKSVAPSAPTKEVGKQQLSLKQFIDMLGNTE
jgi:hypothetical protein